MDKELFCCMTNLEEKEVDSYVKKGLISAYYNEKEFTITLGDEKDNMFSDDNIKEANIIKILEYLEFSIDEMLELKSNNYLELEDVLNEKMLTYTKDTYDVEKKKEIIEVLKVSGFEEEVVECYADGICTDKKGKTKNTESIFNSIGFLLLFSVVDLLLILGEIIFFTKTGLVYTLILSIACIFAWKKYIKNYRKYKHIQKSINKKGFGYIPFIIIGIILFIGLYLLFGFFPICLATNDTYMYQIDYRAEKAFIMCCIIMAMIYRHIVINRKNIKNKAKVIVSVVGAYAISAIITILLALNVTCITEDKIVMFSIFNITGTEYNYNDVDSIKASFGDKKLTFTDWKRRGNFSYVITIDGKKVVFYEPMENDEIKRYENLDYVALEDFDKKLVELGVPKTGNDKYSKYCDNVDSIKKRYVRIANNK